MAAPSRYRDETAHRSAGVWSHLDRVEALAGAVAHFQRAIEAEIEDFLEDFKRPTLPRHAGQWGPGAGLVEPERLEWDVAIVVTHI